MRDVHFEHLNAEGAPQAAQAAYPARILGVSRVRKFSTRTRDVPTRDLYWPDASPRGGRFPMTSAGTRAIPTRARAAAVVLGARRVM